MYFEIGAPAFEASTTTVAETAGRTDRSRQARYFIAVHSKSIGLCLEGPHPVRKGGMSHAMLRRMSAVEVADVEPKAHLLWRKLLPWLLALLFCVLSLTDRNLAEVHTADPPRPMPHRRRSPAAVPPVRSRPLLHFWRGYCRCPHGRGNRRGGFGDTSICCCSRTERFGDAGFSDDGDFLFAQDLPRCRQRRHARVSGSRFDLGSSVRPAPIRPAVLHAHGNPVRSSGRGGCLDEANIRVFGSRSLDSGRIDAAVVLFSQSAHLARLGGLWLTCRPSPGDSHGDAPLERKQLENPFKPRGPHQEPCLLLFRRREGDLPYWWPGGAGCRPGAYRRVGSRADGRRVRQ